MRAARALALAAACLLPLWPQLGAHAAPEGILLVSPFEGYNGNTFYLSGSGFTPFDQLDFYVVCPNVSSPDAYYYRNYALYPGPVVNEHGTFAGYPIRGFTLNVLKSSPCEIRANDATAGLYFVCSQCAQYNIVSPQTSLPSTARLISGKVRATPQHVRAGVAEHIWISGSWGGASALVSVQFPHQAVRKVGPVHLNWHGAGEAVVSSNKSVGVQPGRATVKVTFTLGDRHGIATTSFNVIH